MRGNVMPNNTLERTGKHRGRTVRAYMCARAGAESGSCMAAQVVRQASRKDIGSFKTQ